MVDPVVVQCCLIVRDWAIVFGFIWDCVVCYVWRSDVGTVDYRATAAVRCAVSCVSSRVSYLTASCRGSCDTSPVTVGDTGPRVASCIAVFRCSHIACRVACYSHSLVRCDSDQSRDLVYLQVDVSACHVAEARDLAHSREDDGLVGERLVCAVGAVTI
jgi:hypothetical protein